MQTVRLLAEFVEGLDFKTLETVQLEDQGPPVRGRPLKISKPLVLVSGELVEESEVVGRFSRESVKELLDVGCTICLQSAVPRLNPPQPPEGGSKHHFKLVRPPLRGARGDKSVTVELYQIVQPTA